MTKSANDAFYILKFIATAIDWFNLNAYDVFYFAHDSEINFIICLN